MIKNLDEELIPSPHIASLTSIFLFHTTCIWGCLDLHGESEDHHHSHLSIAVNARYRGERRRANPKLRSLASKLGLDAGEMRRNRYDWKVSQPEIHNQRLGGPNSRMEITCGFTARKFKVITPRVGRDWILNEESAWS
jgi:hypothetical protein